MMRTKNRTHDRCLAALGVCTLVLLVSCSSAAEVPDDSVLITQGTSPSIEGLSIGLGSVSGDEARLSIAQPGRQAELFETTAGETLEIGDHTVEIFEVEYNDEGGWVRLKVTSPQDSPDK
jgi:hypothetical protein